MHEDHEGGAKTQEIKFLDMTAIKKKKLGKFKLLTISLPAGVF